MENKNYTKFIYNNICLKKKTAILIIKISNKVYKLKVYNKTLINLIYNIK